MDCLIPEPVWEYLKDYLEVDPHHGAGFIKDNLPEFKHKVSTSNYGAVLIIEDLDKENAWLGMAGVTTGCCIIHLHFMYVIPEERLGPIFYKLMCEVSQYGRMNYYGYVTVSIPELPDLDSLHRMLSDMSSSATPEMTMAGSQVIKYVIPKAEWEKVF